MLRKLIQIFSFSSERVVGDADPYTKNQSSGTGGETPPLRYITALRKNSGLIFPLIYMRAPARARFRDYYVILTLLLYNVMFACQFPC